MNTSKTSKAGFASHLMELTGNLKQNDLKAPVEPKKAVTSPGRLLDYGPKMQEAEDKLAEALRLKAEAEEILRKGGGADGEIEIEKIVVVPGRRRALTPEQFDELKSNLAKNPLITPVTLSRRADGRLELIAGHNRVQAYRDLGKTKIQYILLPEGAMDTELAAFYSNLMSPALSDYEKFIGFKRRQQSSGLTQMEIATEAGIAQSTVSRLLSFDTLLDEAKEIIASNPSCIGLSAVLEIIALQPRVESNAVVLDALRALAAGTISQIQAVNQIKASLAKPAKPNSNSEEVVKIGRRQVCSIVRRKGTLALKFKNEEEAEAIEKLIADWVRSQISNE